MNRDRFNDFSRRLVERSARTDWPSGGSEFWADFHRELSGIDATYDEADLASRRACSRPDMFVNSFRPFVMAEIPRIRAERAAAEMPSAAGSREEAEASSRDCPECRGTGISVRYVHEDIHGRVKSSRGTPYPVASSTSGWCGSCPHGRFLAAANSAPGRPGRTWDAFPAFRVEVSPVTGRLDNKYLHRPSEWDDARGCPIEPVEIRDAAELRRFCASLAGSFSVGRHLAQADPREPRHGDARALPGDAVPARSELAAAIDDPVVRRELARPAPPAALTIPEDDATSGWY